MEALRRKGVRARLVLVLGLTGFAITGAGVAANAQTGETARGLADLLESAPVAPSRQGEAPEDPPSVRPSLPPGADILVLGGGELDPGSSGVLEALERLRTVTERIDALKNAR
ncbi:hypothetical protein DYI37_11215 [Fulvimarina endophytica]|uniref:Uncharacterized protein n=1 Tax=Fulvimarina endophytica TaxID=2293836 RepID=A0A371X2Z0_9HYPH|nr:hypothetical protein [Fulvimarina endophytica]RFC63576.1 hypothetical protein DYI37_11215 [Fulvimarina endophytica]